MLPKYKEIQEPLLAEIQRRGGRVRPSDQDNDGLNVYEVLADYFGLTSQDLEEKVYEPSGKARSKWKNMVRWARNDLCKLRLLDGSQHGVWALSEEGVQRANLSKHELAGRGVFLPGVMLSPELLQKLQSRAKEIGDLGEMIVLEQERLFLRKAGRDDLAAAVEHVALQNVAAGYDILSFAANGKKKFIEVKSSVGNFRNFEITANELRVAKQKRIDYWIYKVSKIETETPLLEIIQNPVGKMESGQLMLIPTGYQVVARDS